MNVALTTDQSYYLHAIFVMSAVMMAFIAFWVIATIIATAYTCQQWFAVKRAQQQLASLSGQYNLSAARGDECAGMRVYQGPIAVGQPVPQSVPYTPERRGKSARRF